MDQINRLARSLFKRIHDVHVVIDTLYTSPREGEYVETESHVDASICESGQVLTTEWDVDGSSPDALRDIIQSAVGKPPHSQETFQAGSHWLTEDEVTVNKWQVNGVAVTQAGATLMLHQSLYP